MPNYLLTSLLLLLAACNLNTIKMAPTPTHHDESTISEEHLLDIGINLFEPNISEDASENNHTTILEAETHYIPLKLMETIQATGNWGIVYIIPNKQSEMDVWVDGKIIKSDGENLILDIIVSDSTNKKWYQKRYKQTVNNHSYTATSNRTDPFQDIYSQIADDMFRYYLRRSEKEITNIRTVSQLQFAKRFSPDVFGKYIETANNGRLVIKRLPAKNDPVLQRIDAIRERDYLFVDTLQQYYADFARKMEGPYYEWRRASYEEGKALRKVNTQAVTRLAGGILAVIAGIIAQDNTSGAVRTAGQIGILAGGAAVHSGIKKREEAKIHVEALREISASLDAEMEPHTVNLKEDTVTLTGSVNEQYSQWRKILLEIYQTETGLIKQIN